LKISEVTVQDLKEYAREDNNEPEIIKAFTNILVGVKAYINGQTGLTFEQMDTKEDLTMVLFVLANEMYENRQYTVQNDKVSVIIKSILDQYCVNLL
jgi:hypothetical protein